MQKTKEERPGREDMSKWMSEESGMELRQLHRK